MKIRILLSVFCTLLLFAAGCKKNHKEEPEQPKQELSLLGNEARPQWKNEVSNNDLILNMTMLVKIDFSNYAEQLEGIDFAVTDNDLLAAFAGEKCVGEAELIDGLFYLYISNPAEDSESDIDSSGQINLKFYSAVLKNIFMSVETYNYQNDAHFGTASEPITPQFILVK